MKRGIWDWTDVYKRQACCDALIGSVTSGLRYAVVKNNGRYEQTEILDCGRFPDPKRNRSGSAVYRSEEQS